MFKASVHGVKVNWRPREREVGFRSWKVLIYAGCGETFQGLSCIPSSVSSSANCLLSTFTFACNSLLYSMMLTISSYASSKYLEDLFQRRKIPIESSKGRQKAKRYIQWINIIPYMIYSFFFNISLLYFIILWNRQVSWGTESVTKYTKHHYFFVHNFHSSTPPPQNYEMN